VEAGKSGTYFNKKKGWWQGKSKPVTSSRQIQFHLVEFVAGMPLIRKSPLTPPFQRGEFKVSLYKGRFRGILSNDLRVNGVMLNGTFNGLPYSTRNTCCDTRQRVPVSDSPSMPQPRLNRPHSSPLKER